VNRQVTDLFGYTSEQLTELGDQVLASLIHPDDLGLLFEQFERFRTVPRGTVLELEYRVRHANGKWHWVLAREVVYRWTPDGAPQQILGMAQEISDRKHLEMEAAAANRSKDDFIAVVAHELRSPLNSVLGWAKLLQTRKLDEATQAKALETISRNTAAQVQLIEDLLDVSRIARGTLEITLAPIHPLEVVEAALDIVRPMAVTKEIQLVTDLQRTPQISGDFHRLQQIVVNLFTNAIKFTPQKGQVEISLARFESQIQLRVSDTGKGIAAELLPVIFERYQQGQQQGGAKDGLGLGLAIAKHLVELHGGTITAESAGEGQGATFSLRLPCNFWCDHASSN
jgi:PAS domain S-box-containing protein